MRKFNRKKYMMYGDKWYGEVNDFYKVIYSFNKNFIVQWFCFIFIRLRLLLREGKQNGWEMFLYIVLSL